MGILLFSGCKNTLELNDTWKEIDIVYGLLDLSKPIYVSIEKAYLNGDKSAIQIAHQNSDSIYHSDSLDVTLREIQGTEVKAEKKLKKVFVTNKDSGLFSYPGQFLYTPVDLTYKLNPSSTYELVVENTKTGVAVSAKTPIVGNMNFSFPNGTVTFQRSIVSRIIFSAGANAKFYDGTYHIYYTEIGWDPVAHKADSSRQKHLLIDWPIFKSNTNVSSSEYDGVTGDEFYNLLHEYIQTNSTLNRNIDSLTLDLTGGAEDIYNYIQINSPSIGVTQKVTNFTNIKNGYGIFSSSSHEHRKLFPSASLKNEIKKENLDFYKQ